MKVFVGTNLETGQQFLVTVFKDETGGVTVATRPAADFDSWSEPVLLDLARLP